MLVIYNNNNNNNNNISTSKLRSMFLKSRRDKVALVERFSVKKYQWSFQATLALCELGSNNFSCELTTP